jgi:hypothetical protein
MENDLESHGKVMEFCDPTFVGTLLVSQVAHEDSSVAAICKESRKIVVN